MGLITSILVLSFLIFFHELGHFLAARYFGVKVETFSIGFGKVILSKKIGDTLYAISAVPLGGYVKMKGQDDANPLARSGDSDSYDVKTPWQRMIILFAGPFANFLLAFLLYVGISLGSIQELASVVGEVAPDSPAAKAGLQSGDKVVAINNIEVKTWSKMGVLIKNSEGAVKVTLIENNKYQSKIITPQIRVVKNIFGEESYKRIIGIGPKGEFVVIPLTFTESLSHGWERTKEASYMIVKSLQKLLSGVIPSSEVGGIVSIVQVTSEASSIGIVALLSLTALISVNLGVLNLLPIPALDGGHIIFNLYEMIFKRPASEGAMYRLTVAGWAILFSLMALGLYNDINRLIG
jgi:regulator of sigma E protease